MKYMHLKYLRFFDMVSKVVHFPRAFGLGDALVLMNQYVYRKPSRPSMILPPAAALLLARQNLNSKRHVITMTREQARMQVVIPGM
jgi:hypothetical protein